MLERKYNNIDLKIELTSYIDNKQNVWFKGKDIAKILGYSDTGNAIITHVSEENNICILLVLMGSRGCCNPPPPSSVKGGFTTPSTNLQHPFYIP